MFFNHIDKPYKLPEIPKEFFIPIKETGGKLIEIGIDLYNLDTSKEKFVEEFLEKYNIRTEIKTCKLIDIIKEEIKPIIDRAIVGAEPTCDDLKALNYFLLEEEHTEYVPYPLDQNLIPVIFDDQFEKIDRYVIVEDYRIYEKTFSTLWPIYKWIYLVWNMAIPVRFCAAEDCAKIFIPSTDRKKEVYHDQKCYWRESKRRYRKKLKEK